MKAPLSLLTLCVLLSACASPDPRQDSGLQAPPAWQSAHRENAVLSNARWWTYFGSPQLDQLIEQARVGSYDLAAALARVRAGARAEHWRGFVRPGRRQ